jgi:hypothetical protein
MRCLGLVVLLTFSLTVRAVVLEGTEALEISGDAAARMVTGIKDYLMRAIGESPKTRKPTAERLRYIFGSCR